MHIALIGQHVSNHSNRTQIAHQPQHHPFVCIYSALQNVLCLVLQDYSGIALFSPPIIQLTRNCHDQIDYVVRIDIHILHVQLPPGLADSHSHSCTLNRNIW